MSLLKPGYWQLCENATRNNIASNSQLSRDLKTCKLQTKLINHFFLLLNHNSRLTLLLCISETWWGICKEKRRKPERAHTCCYRFRSVASLEEPRYHFISCLRQERSEIIWRFYVLHVLTQPILTSIPIQSFYCNLHLTDKETQVHNVNASVSYRACATNHHNVLVAECTSCLTFL